MDLSAVIVTGSIALGNHQELRCWIFLFLFSCSSRLRCCSTQGHCSHCGRCCIKQTAFALMAKVFLFVSLTLSRCLWALNNKLFFCCWWLFSTGNFSLLFFLVLPIFLQCLFIPNKIFYICFTADFRWWISFLEIEWRFQGEMLSFQINSEGARILAALLCFYQLVNELLSTIKI